MSLSYDQWLDSVPTDPDQVSVTLWDNSPVALTTPVSVSDGVVSFTVPSTGNYLIHVKKDGFGKTYKARLVDGTDYDPTDPRQYTDNKSGGGGGIDLGPDGISWNNGADQGSLYLSGYLLVPSGVSTIQGGKQIGLFTSFQGEPGIVAAAVDGEGVTSSSLLKIALPTEGSEEPEVSTIATREWTQSLHESYVSVPAPPTDEGPYVLKASYGSMTWELQTD